MKLSSIFVALSALALSGCVVETIRTKEALHDASRAYIAFGDTNCITLNRTLSDEQAEKAAPNGEYCAFTLAHTAGAEDDAETAANIARINSEYVAIRHKDDDDYYSYYIVKRADVPDVRDADKVFGNVAYFNLPDMPISTLYEIDNPDTLKFHKDENDTYLFTTSLKTLDHFLYLTAHEYEAVLASDDQCEAMESTGLYAHKLMEQCD